MQIAGRWPSSGRLVQPRVWRLAVPVRCSGPVEGVEGEFPLLRDPVLAEWRWWISTTGSANVVYTLIAEVCSRGLAGRNGRSLVRGSLSGRCDGYDFGDKIRRRCLRDSASGVTHYCGDDRSGFQPRRVSRCPRNGVDARWLSGSTARELAVPCGVHRPLRVWREDLNLHAVRRGVEAVVGRWREVAFRANYAALLT